MTEAQNKTRRRHSAELKQQILAECAQPGASVASVALSHGINANVVHKWRRLAHPVGPYERARPVCLPQGRAHATAHAQGQPHRRAPATPLETRRRLITGLGRPGFAGRLRCTQP